MFVFIVVFCWMVCVCLCEHVCPCMNVVSGLCCLFFVGWCVCMHMFVHKYSGSRFWDGLFYLLLFVGWCVCVSVCMSVCICKHTCVFAHTFGLYFALYNLNPVTRDPDRLVMLN